MVFSSFFFIFGFLPFCLASYLFCPKKFKNIVLLFWSLIFYAWGTLSFLPIFLAGCVFDFFAAKEIAKNNKLKKTWLVLALTINLGILIYYKYSNFFIGEINSVISYLGISPIDWKNIILPIGISFITFQRVSYLIDIYRGDAKPANNLLNYILYIAFFPQLIAGPIVRYRDIAEQILNRHHSLQDIWTGSTRFCLGLAKKVLIADALGNVTNNVDKLGLETMSTGYAWLGVICYGLQLYYDFSGYSDMAIGLARMFGFKLLENFDRPFISQTFTEFWRRWHISLSRVMRDYLYIPLGGNRSGAIRSTINLWVVFLFSGLWHGANWTFVAFGAFHGLFMTIDKLGWGKFTEKLSKRVLGRIFNSVLFLFLLQISWVFFKSPSFSSAWRYLDYMFNIPKYWNAEIYKIPSDVIHNEALFILIVAVIGIFAPSIPAIKKAWIRIKTTLDVLPHPTVQFITCLVTLLICSVVLASTNFTPFIYFQF